MESSIKKSEFTLVTTEDFCKMAKSKKDLYYMFSHQLLCVLPPFRECTVEFLKGVLADENKVIRVGDAAKFHMPYFPELSVDKIWPFVKSDQELVKYFPKYKGKQIPNRDYFYCVLSSKRPEQVKSLLNESLRNRSIYKDREDGEYIKISNKWYEKLQEVVNIPRRLKV